MKAIKKFFSFSASENKGILLLSFLFFCLILVRIYLRYSAKDVAVKPPFDITFSDDSTQNKQTDFEEKDDIELGNSEIKIDINKATKIEFESIGIPSYLAARIVKYRDVIGGFKNMEQFKKTYGMNENLYQKILPNIYLNPVKDTKNSSVQNTEIPKKEKPKDAKKIIILTKINLADSTEIDLIKGVSSNFTSKILKYRKRLGGFYSKNQLSEIYYFGYDKDSQYYHLILENIDINENEITKININNATIEILGNHPYIGFQKAKIILAFIKQHQKIHSFEELQKIAFISEENIQKLKYYLVFE